MAASFLSEASRRAAECLSYSAWAASISPCSRADRKLCSRKASATASRAPKLAGEMMLRGPKQDIGHGDKQHQAPQTAEHDPNDARQKH